MLGSLQKVGQKTSSVLSNLLFHHDEGLVSGLHILREVDTLVKSSTEAWS